MADIFSGAHAQSRVDCLLVLSPSSWFGGRIPRTGGFLALDAWFKMYELPKWEIQARRSIRGMLLSHSKQWHIDVSGFHVWRPGTGVFLVCLCQCISIFYLLRAWWWGLCSESHDFRRSVGAVWQTPVGATKSLLGRCKHPRFVMNMILSFVTSFRYLTMLDILGSQTWCWRSGFDYTSLMLNSHKMCSKQGGLKTKIVFAASVTMVSVWNSIVNTFQDMRKAFPAVCMEMPVAEGRYPKNLCQQLNILDVRGLLYSDLQVFDQTVHRQIRSLFTGRKQILLGLLVAYGCNVRTLVWAVMDVLRHLLNASHPKRAERKAGITPSSQVGITEALVPWYEFEEDAAKKAGQEMPKPPSLLSRLLAAAATACTLYCLYTYSPETDEMRAMARTSHKSILEMLVRHGFFSRVAKGLSFKYICSTIQWS